MIKRIWWFVVGLVVGCAVTVRALGRRPERFELRKAAVDTSADLMTGAARMVRPRRRG
jgi:hypothetical protein